MLLFKSDTTHKNMTFVRKSWMYHILADSSMLAESAIQTVKDHKVAVSAAK